MQLQKFVGLILIWHTSGALTTPVLKPNWNMPKMAVKIDKAKKGVTVAMILADSCQSCATGFVFGWSSFIPIFSVISVRCQLVFFILIFSVYPFFLNYFVVYGLPFSE